MWLDGIPLQEDAGDPALPKNPIITAGSGQKCAYTLLAVVLVACNAHERSPHETVLQGDYASPADGARKKGRAMGTYGNDPIFHRAAE
jgi:hypothetical protein